MYMSTKEVKFYRCKKFSIVQKFLIFEKKHFKSKEVIQVVNSN